MSYIDYYKLLDIDKKATPDEIKKSYRKLARKYHPDLNPNDKEAEKIFKEINEANEVLSDPENRKKYDAYGKDWKHSEQFEQAKHQRSRGTQSESFNESHYSDFFESFFGGSSTKSNNVKFKGQDFNAELHLNIREAYKTHQQILTVNGKNIRITIPAGIKNEQKIKITGKGSEGINGGPNGDLFLTFKIKNTTSFKLVDDNLYSVVELDLYTALLGGDVTVETFDGKVKLTVKPETQSGIKIKLAGKGFPIYKKEGTFGDLIITYQIKLPTNLTTKEKELFTELSKLRTHE